MTLPAISICIPAYNSSPFLQDTLESIRAQAWTNWELIVVEDGSRDGTERLVETFAGTVSQSVSYRRHDFNQGLSITRNTGFALARGPWIAMLDGDDLWRPNHLSLCHGTADRLGADLVFSGCQLFDSDTGTLEGQRVPPPGSMEDFPASLHDGRVVIQPSSTLMRRELILAGGGFDAEFQLCNDLEFWFRQAKRGRKFGYTGEITCDYRKHAGGLSSHGAEMAADCAEIHFRYRDWAGISRVQRRGEAWRHHRNAARMLFRSNPRAALRLLSRGLAGLVRG